MSFADKESLSDSMQRLNISGDDEVRKSERTPKLTEKAKDYKTDSLNSNKEKYLKKIERKKNVINDLLQSSYNVKTVREEMSQVDDFFRALKDVSMSLERIGADDDWFEETEESFCEFKRKIYNWIKAVEEEKDEDARSRSSTKRSERSSKGSRSSIRSSRSSKSEKALEEKKKLRELEIEEQFAEKKAEAKLFTERLLIKEKIEKMKARVDIDDQEDIKQRALDDIMNIDSLNLERVNTKQEETVDFVNTSIFESPWSNEDGDFNVSEKAKCDQHEIKTEEPSLLSEAKKEESKERSDFLTSWQRMMSQNDANILPDIAANKKLYKEVSSPRVEENRASENEERKLQFESKDYSYITGAKPKRVTFQNGEEPFYHNKKQIYAQDLSYDYSMSENVEKHHDKNSLRGNKETSKANIPSFQSTNENTANDVRHGSRYDHDKMKDETSAYLFELLQMQAAPNITMETFKGNPMEFQCFMAFFHEVVEKRIKSQVGRLTRLLQFTEGEPNDLIRHCIHGDKDTCYNKAVNLLKRQYGSSQKITTAYKDQLINLQSVKPNDAVAMRKLFMFLLKVDGVCIGSNYNPLDVPDTLCRVLAKLPTYLQDRFNKGVHMIRKTQHREPCLKDLITLIEEESTMLNDPLFSRQAVGKYIDKKETGNKHGKSNIRSFGCEIGDKKEQRNQMRCPFCERTNHTIEYCRDYLKLGLSERHRCIFKCRLCFKCLKPISKDHSASNCSNPIKCKVCNGAHPTTLHGFSRTMKKQDEHLDDKATACNDGDENPVKAMTTKRTSSKTISICIVPVDVTHAESNKTVHTYAMLDTCSQGSFISTDLADSLGLIGRPTVLSVYTVNGLKEHQTNAISKLKVRKRDSKEDWITISRSYTQNEIPVNESDLINYEEVKKWPHLQEIANEIKSSEVIKVGLLIGADCPRALEPRRCIQSKNNGPFAFETRLGWCVVGPVAADINVHNTQVATHRISCLESNCEMIPCENKFKECDTTKMIIKMYNQEFAEKSTLNQNEEALSIEDRKFLKIVTQGSKLVDGKQQVPLPFKKDKFTMKSNETQAYRRFRCLERKFEKNEEFKKLYIKAMSEMMTKGYAEKADVAKEGCSWFIPHHGVSHPAKPDKVRVVFDASAEYQGDCINRELLKGPDLTNQLIGVLIRFREEKVAIMADIEGMFFQVKVPPHQRSYLQFLWYDDCGSKSKIRKYQMTSHVFGATSSPACCNFALRKTAQENKHRYHPLVRNSVLQNFYVDDLLKSIPSENIARTFVKEIKSLCAESGFNLTKFTSNQPSVLQELPDKDVRQLSKASDANNLLNQTPEESTLGMKWNTREDTLSFKLNKDTKPLTRRGLLSTISSVYDPLGLIGPLVLKGRIVLQKLCKSEIGWDDPIPEYLVHDWMTWRNSLSSIEDTKVERCLKPKIATDVKETTLHIFADASDAGHGIASYIRFVDSDDKVYCSLLYGRSRVNPIKYVSIPRMELCAALLAARTGAMLLKEIETPVNSIHYYSDSQVVLSYLRSEARKFKIFVANRVQEIQELTEVSSWHHVSSKDNPADHASRGINVQDRSKLSQWFSGPRFLQERDLTFSAEEFTVNEDDDEVKITKRVNFIKESKSILTSFTEKFGDWERMVRKIALLKLFVRLWRSKTLKIDHPTSLDVSLLDDTKEFIIKSLQQEVYSNEIKNLSRSKQVPTSSPILKLSPILVNGVLRVGGRLSNSSLPFQLKHPVIIPKRTSVTNMLIRHFHKECAHGGRNATVNFIRKNGYWIINCSSQVKYILSKCITCRKLFRPCEQQMMGNLPPERSSTDPPFTHVGVDAFGPILIKEKRSTLKRYGILFTCLSLRSVHIEVVSSLTTDSFILALRRFIGRRGNVRTIRSDNGSNFIGAAREITEAFKEMNHERIKDFLMSKHTDWIYWKQNPPYASNMGGVWERQIRSVRRILSVLMQDNKEILNTEALNTLMVEIEMIINTRPLTVESIEDPSILPLSPMNILTMKEGPFQPLPGIFSNPDKYSRKQWRRVQYLADQFWRRWRQEYLSSLQERQKWRKETRNIQRGDIVLIQEESMRQKWPMGRVEKTYPDANGNVRIVLIKVPNDGSTKKKEYIKRPVNKLVVLIESDSQPGEP